MKRILVSWIGRNDLNALLNGPDEMSAFGPIASTLEAESFDHAYLPYNYPMAEVSPYLDWLSSRVPTAIQSNYHKLSSPIHFGEIHAAAEEILNQILRDHPDHQLNILLSPGTPAMQAVWILLGKTRYPALFYQSSVEQGVQQIEIPFDIAAEFLPNAGKRLTDLAQSSVAIDAAFDDILTRNPRMEELKGQATRMAQVDVPVLIYGETGTGKELFATAIHNASKRKNAPFVPVNCGAIPGELIDSVLFGHVKGAFTGATTNRTGYFVEADGGTLFLDEFGELPPEAQVRLLRVLQSGEIYPVGSSKGRRVNVRIIAATNRNLIDEVGAGRFREDLFYRIAVGVLHLPPLRERKGDLALLTDALLEQIAAVLDDSSMSESNKISPNARNIIISHPWRGNVRELHSTLLRAALWSRETMINEKALQAALFQSPSGTPAILDQEITEGFSIQSVIDQVVQHYIPRTLEQTGGKRARAAELLGLKNYQTLDNWIRKHDVKT